MVHRALRTALLASVVVGAACSVDAPERPSPPAPPPAEPPIARLLVDPQPAVAPEIPDVSGFDHDGTRVDDRFEDAARAIRADAAAAPTIAGSAAALARLDEKVSVEAIFEGPITHAEVDAFTSAGGTVRHVFRAVSHGFTGRISRRDLDALSSSALGPRLLLLKADQVVVLHLDEATRTGRVRPVWAGGFAGHPSGYSGVGTIAIIDSGVDATHVDLAGASVGWKDFTDDAAPTATDVRGHGTHVAGIALGRGTSFGVGGGPLKYTDTGTLADNASSTYQASPMHFPATFEVTVNGTWSAGSALMSVKRNTDGAMGPYQTVASVTGASPQTLVYSGASTATQRFTVALTQNATKSVTSYALANTVTSYPAVDGQPALRGVAIGSSWYAAKVFPVTGAGTTADIAAAMDEIVSLRKSLDIRVANMSFGIPGGGVDTTQRSKANTMVANGIVVVVSGGNDGSGAPTGDPGRARNVITVGATNDRNELSAFNSGGWGESTSGTDVKLDVVAPGGSAYRSAILAPDSNTADGDDEAFADVQANDYRQLIGSSMAAPFVSGSASLLIEALGRAGHVWSYDATTSPFLVKMLLLGSATETNATRELGVAPPVGRATSPKDQQEGYGLVNPDAAIEAATLSWNGDVFSDSTAAGPHDRRAWGRKIAVPAGKSLKLALAVPATGDFDVYVYESAPSANGSPVLLAWGDASGFGVDEVITRTFAVPTNLYVFVKRISGDGAFSLTGQTYSCGDGVLEAGEQCDDGNGDSGDCCDSGCQVQNDGQTCDDGDACSASSACSNGKCLGASFTTCPPGNNCELPGACNPVNGQCAPVVKPNGSPCTDGDACTQTDTCAGGVCVGTNPVVCGGTTSCANGGACDPATGACSSTPKADGTPCDDGNACTLTDGCKTGICEGTSQKSCPPPPDPCKELGTCNPNSGECAYVPKPDGTSCDDGNACTQADTCQAGVCTGASPVVCGAGGSCSEGGSCDPATGTCSSAAKPDGTPCDDDNPCTQTDTCAGGVCKGATPKTCPPAADACHQAGTCNPGTGQCTNAPAIDGTPCDDGNACTQTDTCQAGVCVGAIPVACGATVSCAEGGTCNPATGECSGPAKPDGTPCTDGNDCTLDDACVAGVCKGASVVVCDAADACREAGTCIPQLGLCMASWKPDGTTCDDGNACTKTDTCKAGACAGSAPVICEDVGPCDDEATCSPASGLCARVPKADGTACSGGTCVAGTCTSEPVGGGSSSGGEVPEGGSSPSGSPGLGESFGPGDAGPGSRIAVAGAGCSAGAAPHERSGALLVVAGVLALRRRRRRR